MRGAVFELGSFKTLLEGITRRAPRPFAGAQQMRSRRPTDEVARVIRAALTGVDRTLRIGANGTRSNRLPAVVDLGGNEPLGGEAAFDPIGDRAKPIHDLGPRTATAVQHTG